MHLHILGICGTFMGGLALIARAAGHRVTGCDANVYPPMSDQLAAQGIELIQGWNADQIALKPDVFVVGNVVTRGNPLMEEILDRGFPYISGPQWLRENILAGKWVLAVAGTHGKTTTAAMLAWILEESGLEPGFLIGGVPTNFSVSARLNPPQPPFAKGGQGGFFVVEADEYDTAFFDKRAKFVHYPARTAILNNLEFDHADIFPDLAAIETQFHHFVRALPSSALIVANGADAAIGRVLARGCYTPVERFGVAEGWSAGGQHAGAFDVLWRGEKQGRVAWSLTGAHNEANALAAIAAARHCGIAPAQAIAALVTFENVKRRMEVRGIVNGVAVYDDFAHHPTEIMATLEGLRGRVNSGQRPPTGTRDSRAAKAGAPSTCGVASTPGGVEPAPPSGGRPLRSTRQGYVGGAGVLPTSGVASMPKGMEPAPPSGGRIIAVLEPRSNTMKLGVLKDRLAASLAGADRVFCYSAGLKWDASAALAPLGEKAEVHADFERLLESVAGALRPGDHVVIMSNGGFNAIHEKLLARLAKSF